MAESPVLVFLSREGRAGRLLAKHVDDGTGRCAVCSAGPQAGRKRWPCLLAEYAASAARLDTGEKADPVDSQPP